MMHVSGISFSYNSHPILRDITTHFPAGQMIGILGANGAGKSTLLKLLASILRPKSGTISFQNKILSQWPRHTLAREMAYVPQEMQTPFPFRVQELVLMGRIPHLPGFGFGSAHDHRVAEEALRAVDAWRFQERRFTELSGGERQRVVIARALAQEPRVMILDEPTAFLDIQHQVMIMKFLQQWRAQTGGTVIAALHDLNLAAQFCRSVVLLKNNAILAQGATETTLTYANVCATFDNDVYVGMNELNGRPYFVPM
jgi:iron complex transport system ATP-binding protein